VLRKNVKIELLKRVPLFSACSRRELDEISMIADEIGFPAGKVLIREGDRGRQFIVVVEGTVEVQRSGRTLPTRGGGEFYGEISLLSDAPTSATVTTTSAVRALVISPESFRALLKRSPAIQLKVLTALADRLAPETV
jgi:CRP-like cAMP-binding protein